MPAQGGMPVRVKCLHVLVAHSLAVGPGVNPFGDEALDAAAGLVGQGAVRRPGRPGCPAGQEDPLEVA